MVRLTVQAEKPRPLTLHGSQTSLQTDTTQSRRVPQAPSQLDVDRGAFPLWQERVSTDSPSANRGVV